MILEATHTHLYPGSRGTVSGPARIDDITPGGDCLVAFADGSAATARITRSANDWQLATAAYRTAAGTEIIAKYWIVSLREDGGRIEFRIIDKLAPERANQIRPFPVGLR